MVDYNRVYWLSGSPCGGKTTVSDAIVQRFDWNIYHLDQHWDAHRDRANPARQPLFYTISQLTGDDLWLRPLAEQIATEPMFVEETFPLIIEDMELLLAQDGRPLLVDASVVPASILTLLPSKNHIFYLIPSEQFQREQYTQRCSINGTLSQTSDPELAWQNWMARDAAYARWLKEQVQQFELPLLEVDGNLSLGETIALVARHYLGEG